MRINKIQIKDFYINQYIENLKIEYVNNIKLNVKKDLVCSTKRYDLNPTNFFKTYSDEEIDISNISEGVSGLNGIPLGQDQLSYGFNVESIANSTVVKLTGPTNNWVLNGWTVGTVLTINVGGSLVSRRIIKFDSSLGNLDDLAIVERTFSETITITVGTSFYQNGRAPNTWYGLWLIINPNLSNIHPDKFGFVLIPIVDVVSRFFSDYHDIRYIGSIFLNDDKNIKPFIMDMSGNSQEVSWNFNMDPDRKLITSTITNPSTNIPNLYEWNSPNSDKVLLGYDITSSNFFENTILNIGTNPGFVERKIESQSILNKNYNESWFIKDENNNIQFSNTGGTINIWAHGYRESI